MKTKKGILAGVAMIVIWCVSFLLAPPLMAEVIVLKHADCLTGSHTQSVVIVTLQKEIERRTEGRVKFQNFWAGSLAGCRDVFKAVQSGLADCGIWIPPYNPEISHLITGIATSGTGLYGIGSTIRAFNELYWGRSTKPISALREYFNKMGVELLTQGTVGSQEIIANVPLTEPTVLKGKRIRGSSSLRLNCKEYGATFVNMTWGEVYESLMRGVLDGTYSYKFSIVNDKAWEYVKHTTWNLGNAFELQWTWNKKKLDSLPEDIRNIIFDVTFEQGPWVHKNIFDDVEAKALTTAKSHGMNVYPINKESRAAWKKGYERTISYVVEQSKEKGYPAEEYLQRYYDEQFKWAPLYGEDKQLKWADSYVKVEAK